MVYSYCRLLCYHITAGAIVRGMSLSILKGKSKNTLTLKKKVEVIKAAAESHVGVRRLAEQFNCGRTQISSILKSKEAILELYESNAGSSSICMRKRVKSSEFSEINEALHKWYLIACSKNIYPSGPQLCEKAREIAQRLHVEGFKASNGWIKKWKRRYNVRYVKISGESADVSGITVESWKERVCELIEGYAAEDIWNLDETGCFWKALPDRGFAQKGTSCHGGKKSKERMTVAFLVNAAGSKETAIVIWKSAKPRCFKSIDISNLPVLYFSQPKAWMTADILVSVLTKLNRKLSSKGRNIILLMDNAGCHPENAVKDRFSNIKVIFLPPNTTSKLQPLDLGIIQNFKVKYRTLFLRFVLSQIDACSKASEVTKSLSILHSIRWVAQAWDTVSPETIRRCFRKAGILDDSFSVPTRPHEHDPFLDIDLNTPEIENIESLMEQIQPEGGICSSTEFINGDDDLVTCFETDDDSWDQQFLTSLDSQSASSAPGVSSDPKEEEEEEEELEPPQPKVRKLSEAISHLEGVREFLDNKGHIAEATIVSSAVDKLALLHCKTRQSHLDDYLLQS